MTFDRNLKIGIISSILATFLFIYFLDPLLRFITFILFKTFRSISHGYTDRLFEQAALLTGPDPSLMLLSTAAGTICGIGLFLIIFLLFLYPLPDRIQEKHLLRKMLRTSRFPKPFIRGIGIILAILMIIGPLMSLYNTMFQLRIITSFTQHLVLLAPYITDQESKLLRSRWTQIKSKQDFDTLYRDLNQIAKTNGLVLPENKIYSFSGL